ncbi:unnamed protein product, partial [Scytosiphon promiscuus]
RKEAGAKRGGAKETFRPPSLVRHESLPSLHLNARCLKCNAVGTIYCKGCEAHFCARHDQRRHRFLLRKDRHEHHPVPGISYFRIPLPDDDGNGSPLLSDDGDTGSEGPSPPRRLLDRRLMLTATHQQDAPRATGGGGGSGGSARGRGGSSTATL